MRIALIFPSSRPNPDFSSLTTQERNMGTFPPLSLAYVAAIAEKAGHKVTIIDANALNLSPQEVTERLDDFNPDMLGFAITTYTFFDTLDWIRYIKNKINCPVLIGGVHVGLYPQETMHYQEIDFALMGEVDSSLPLFLSEYEGGRNFKDIPGLCFRKNGNVYVNEQTGLLEDLDQVPYPARHLLPNNVYYSFVSQRKNFTAMLTTRGCRFRCIYCSLREKLRLRSAKNVVDEIEEGYHKFNIREIDIFDASFTIDKRRVLDICNQILQRKLDLRWTIRTRIDLVDEGLLQEMSKAGCRMAMYGIESASQQILKRLHKDADIERIRRVVRWTKEAGISPLGFFMIGSPGETHQTAKETIRFAKSLGLDYVQFTKLTPFPGTELYEQYVAENKDDYWRRFILDRWIQQDMRMVDTCMTAAEAKQYVRKAYISFYLRPIYLLRILCKTHFRQWLRFARAFMDVLMSCLYSKEYT